MRSQTPRVLVSWSSGKDSAWAIHVLRQDTDFEIVGLLTTFNEAFDRVAMHAVRRELVEAQAAAAGLPLVSVPLPYPCSNEVYEDRMKAALFEAKATSVTHVAFGEDRDTHVLRPWDRGEANQRPRASGWLRFARD